MRRVVIFSNKKSILSTEPDIERLNKQIEDIEKDGWTVLSVSANTDFLGGISSYTILIES
ncbi:hypothetical protein [Pseudoalteromonas xiamenensis]